MKYEGVSEEDDWVWALPILWEQGECWMCVCFGCGGVGGEWVGDLEGWSGVRSV